MNCSLQRDRAGSWQNPRLPMAGEDPADPFAVVRSLPESHEWLPCGSVRPAGWLAAQMRRDLDDGFVGRLDALLPALLRDDDLYGRDRLSRSVSRKELGVLAPEAQWEAQWLWWNSESQSNWWDGLVRSALQLEHPRCTARAAAHVERMLGTQDADGYLGIYAPDLRFRCDGENGELWAQATLLRTLLAYFEATGDGRCLSAVERAVAAVRRAYPAGASHPFTVPRPFAGVGHGLAFTDVLDRLSQLTGEPSHRRYAAWLYREYSQSEQSQADVQYRHLVDPGRRFQDHGVHTYEHLRSLLVAVHATANPSLERALAGYLDKLERCLAPSGGPIGDEFIGGREADAGATGYEYCSIQELLDSYTHLLQKRGGSEWGDRAEWLFFNAGQGARHPRAPAIAYLKTDNSFSMTGPLDPAAEAGPEGPQTRYKYSPAHQDVAVCCVPNAGRLAPYFVKAMWLRSPGGLVAALYGPCELLTRVHGVRTLIVERTRYPFGREVELLVDVEQPVAFELALRRPAWADLAWSAPDALVQESAGWIRLSRTWRSGDRVRLDLRAGAEVQAYRPGASFVRQGPLLFALPLPGREVPGREYAPGGFRDLYYEPEAGEGPRRRWALDPSARPGARAGGSSDEAPWLDPPTVDVELHEPATGSRLRAQLLPLGSTILRQVTFARA